MKLKIQTGRVSENISLSGVKIDLARENAAHINFCIKKVIALPFYDIETYEQLTIEEELINNPGLLKEGQTVEIMYHADTDTPLTWNYPPS